MLNYICVISRLEVSLGMLHIPALVLVDFQPSLASDSITSNSLPCISIHLFGDKRLHFNNSFCLHHIINIKKRMFYHYLFLWTNKRLQLVLLVTHLHAQYSVCVCVFKIVWYYMFYNSFSSTNLQCKSSVWHFYNLIQTKL